MGGIGRNKKANNKTRCCMGKRNSVAEELDDEAHQAIAEAYAALRVTDTGEVRPEDCKSLEGFQAAFAAADEWEALGLIEILEIGEDREQGWLIQPIRFRRLK
jgi:hypothetical protein